MYVGMVPEAAKMSKRNIHRECYTVPMKLVFALCASALIILGQGLYLRDILREKIKPHPYTWLIWCIVALVLLFGQVDKGAGIGALPTAVALAGTTCILFTCVRHLTHRDVERITWFDHMFLIIALLSIIPWIITRDPTVSVIAIVCIDILAFIPTIRKTWARPQTERPIPYGLSATRHILSLLSLNTYNIVTALDSAVMVIMNVVMVMIMRRKR